MQQNITKGLAILFIIIIVIAVLIGIATIPGNLQRMNESTDLGDAEILSYENFFRQLESQEQLILVSDDTNLPTVTTCTDMETVNALENLFLTSKSNSENIKLTTQVDGLEVKKSIPNQPWGLYITNIGNPLLSTNPSVVNFFGLPNRLPRFSLVQLPLNYKYDSQVKLQSEIGFTGNLKTKYQMYYEPSEVYPFMNSMIITKRDGLIKATSQDQGVGYFFKKGSSFFVYVFRIKMILNPANENANPTIAVGIRTYNSATQTAQDIDLPLIIPSDSITNITNNTSSVNIYRLNYPLEVELEKTNTQIKSRLKIYRSPDLNTLNLNEAENLVQDYSFNLPTSVRGADTVIYPLVRNYIDKDPSNGVQMGQNYYILSLASPFNLLDITCN